MIKLVFDFNPSKTNFDNQLLITRTFNQNNANFHEFAIIINLILLGSITL
jgi:hypothetical protein